MQNKEWSFVLVIETQCMRGNRVERGTLPDGVIEDRCHFRFIWDATPERGSSQKMGFQVDCTAGAGNFRGLWKAWEAADLMQREVSWLMKKSKLIWKRRRKVSNAMIRSLDLVLLKKGSIRGIWREREAACASGRFVWNKIKWGERIRAKHY